MTEWAKPIITRGRRPQFEMEQVLPGMDPDDPDPDADPIRQAVDHKDAGDREGAYKILMDLCQADLRCLDAHAHLGNLVFDSRPKDAIRHYEVGFRIGELSLGNISMVCCRGAGSTTVPSCVACMDSGCACGG